MGALNLGLRGPEAVFGEAEDGVVVLTLKRGILSEYRGGKCS